MKILHYIRTKKHLFSLYLSQYSERLIRTYINNITAQYRPNESPKCRNISLQEFLTFIELYGIPQDYTLNQKLKENIKKIKN